MRENETLSGSIHVEIKVNGKSHRYCSDDCQFSAEDEGVEGCFSYCNLFNTRLKETRIEHDWVEFRCEQCLEKFGSFK